MNICRFSEYSESEYAEYRKRWDLLPEGARDFDTFFSNKLPGKEFDEFLRKRTVSPMLMAMVLNIVQNEDESNFERARSMYFDLVDVDYDKEMPAGQKRRVQVFTSVNLLSRQLNLDETLYVVAVVRKFKKGVFSDDHTWQMVILRLPTRQMRVFANAMDKQDRFDAEWRHLQEGLGDIHQMDFRQFRQDFVLPKKDSYDGALPIFNILVRFIQGLEFEHILKVNLDLDDTFRRVAWLLLKIKFNEALRKRREQDEQAAHQYKYEHPVEMYLGDRFHAQNKISALGAPQKRVFQELLKNEVGESGAQRVYGVRGQRKKFRDRAVQTLISVDPDYKMNYLEFNEYLTHAEIDTRSKSTLTDPLPVPPKPVFDIEQIKKLDRPYKRNFAWRSEQVLDEARWREEHDLQEDDDGNFRAQRTLQSKEIPPQMYPSWPTNPYGDLQKYTGLPKVHPHHHSNTQHHQSPLNAPHYVRDILDAYKIDGRR